MSEIEKRPAELRGLFLDSYGQIQLAARALREVGVDAPLLLAVADASRQLKNEDPDAHDEDFSCSYWVDEPNTRSQLMIALNVKLLEGSLSAEEEIKIHDLLEYLKQDSQGEQL